MIKSLCIASSAIYLKYQPVKFEQYIRENSSEALSRYVNQAHLLTHKVCHTKNLTLVCIAKEIQELALFHGPIGEGKRIGKKSN